MNVDETITGWSLDSLRDHIAEKKVVLLYPHNPYRQVFLSHCLRTAGPGLVYYALPEDGITLRVWLADLTSRLATANLKSHLQESLENSAGAADLGGALAADLACFPTSLTMLVLDQPDRAPDTSELQAFLSALIDQLADGVQVVICSRTLRYQPWYKWVTAGKAVVLGTEARLYVFNQIRTPKVAKQWRPGPILQGYKLAL